MTFRASSARPDGPRSDGRTHLRVRPSCRPRPNRAAALCAGVWLLVAACGRGDQPQRADSHGGAASDLELPSAKATDTLGGAGTGSMEVAEGPPSDNTIFATLASVNGAEVDAGRIAQERAADTSVRAFAGDMVRAHTELQRQAEQLAAKLELAPQPLAEDTIQAKAAVAETTLNAARGAAFDRAYVRGQVEAHDNAVRMLRNAQGAAANPALKELLRGTIPKVEQHLRRARELQRRLGGGT